jgi:hypothetical protein
MAEGDDDEQHTAAVFGNLAEAVVPQDLNQDIGPGEDGGTEEKNRDDATAAAAAPGNDLDSRFPRLHIEEKLVFLFLILYYNSPSLSSSLSSQQSRTGKSPGVTFLPRTMPPYCGPGVSK